MAKILICNYKFINLALLLSIFQNNANFKLSTKLICMKKILLLIFAIFVILCLNGYGQSNKTLPGISLKDVNGNMVNIQEYGKSGKITVISFWATWCAPCKKELENISQHYDEWKKEYNMQLIAVSIDNARNIAKVKPYVDGQGWDYEVLLDSNEELKRAMNVATVPFTILVDKNGNIVYTHQGYVEGEEYVLEEKIQQLR